VTTADPVWIAIVGGINGAGKTTTVAQLRADPGFADATFWTLTKSPPQSRHTIRR
jgi:hypothetical protein